MRVMETLQAFGHPNISASHRTTFEVTRARTVSPSGNCVIAVSASKGALELTPAFKQVAQNKRTRITVLLEVDELRDQVVGWGHPALTFTHPEELVARTSSFTCPRTIMIRTDKAARNLSRALIRRLQNPQQQIQFTFIAEQYY